MLLSWLPADMTGKRLLDAGCGTGALAVEAARRGAHVVAIDVAPTLIALAGDRAPNDLGAGSHRVPCRRHARSRAWRVRSRGLDGRAHPLREERRGSRAGFARRAHERFDHLHLRAAHAVPRRDAFVGKIFPRSDRSPAIQPVAPAALERAIASSAGPRALGSGAQRSREARLLHFARHGVEAAMMLAHPSVVKLWTRVSTRLLPFADVASAELPLARLLRLSLFQVTVGMAMALMVGTLNRVMIVELGVRASIVALAIATPLIISPMRALIGFKSDHHRSAFGWRRVPYLWFGTLVQFGGLSIMPFALLLLTGDHDGPEWLGPAAAALSFLLVGAGMQTVQTAGLALATDLAPRESAPARRGADVCHAAGRHGRQRADLRPADGRLLAHQAGAGRAGRRARHHGRQRRRPVEAGAARSPARDLAAPRKPRSCRRGTPSFSPRARSAFSWPWASAPLHSACRTLCWSPMAARS